MRWLLSVVHARLRTILRTRIMACMTFLLLGVCATCGSLLIDAHQQARRDAGRAVDNVAAALGFDLFRNVELLDLSIHAVVEGWSNDEVRALKPSLRRQVLFDHSAAARHFGPILVLDRYGSLLESSDGSASVAGSYATREGFQAHAASATLGLFISKPFRDGPDGPWSLAFSRRLNDPDGSFAGIVTGTLRLSYMQDAYGRMQLGKDALMTLYNIDGTLLAREPRADSKLGTVVLNAETIARVNGNQSDPDDTFEATSPIDGVTRVFGYRRVGQLPLVQFAAESTEDVYAAFWTRAAEIGTLLATLSTGIALLLVLAKREIDHRVVAETRLQELATTDDLTGLMNRRAFKAVLDRERRFGDGREGSVGLLMIDVDHFKSYNDTYGHGAGDVALCRIAEAIASAASLHGGLASRYGGEEFAVVLPAPQGAHAAKAAEDIRKAIIDLREPHAGSAFKIVTITVGASSIALGDPRPNATLLKAADQELYRAKALGRNRSCTGEPLAEAA